jgi:uncharacterized membrane protein HdeD (DUF308 family)
MNSLNIKNWNLSVLNGVLAIIFGLIALLFPGITITGLAIYFAITILIGGLSLIINVIRSKDSVSKWYYSLLEGVIGVLIGIVILAQPESAATFFIAIIGIWALFIGLVFLFSYFKKAMPELVSAFQLVAGIISAVIGILIILNPFESTRIIAVLVGIYAIAYGTFSLVNTSKNK